MIIEQEFNFFLFEENPICRATNCCEHDIYTIDFYLPAFNKHDNYKWILKSIIKLFNVELICLLARENVHVDGNENDYYAPCEKPTLGYCPPEVIFLRLKDGNENSTIKIT